MLNLKSPTYFKKFILLSIVTPSNLKSETTFTSMLPIIIEFDVVICLLVINIASVLSQLMSMVLNEHHSVEQWYKNKTVDDRIADGVIVVSTWIPDRDPSDYRSKLC